MAPREYHGPARRAWAARALARDRSAMPRNAVLTGGWRRSSIATEAARIVAKINEAYRNLQATYLFSEIKRRTQAFRDARPDARLVNLGIGDVTLPLPAAVVQALEDAAQEMARSETFKGYGPYVGYEFLRAEIAAH